MKQSLFLAAGITLVLLMSGCGVSTAIAPRAVPQGMPAKMVPVREPSSVHNPAPAPAPAPAPQ